MRKLHGMFDVVFDVGANTGQFGSQVKHWWSEAEVHSFEPIPDVAVELANTARRYRGWLTYPLGLAVEPGVYRMFRNDTTVCSSLKEMAELHRVTYPFSARTKEVDCVFDSLDNYADMIEGVALLKVDTQGSEMEVLKGGRSVLSRFSAVMLEVSWQELYKGVPSFDDLNVFLEGFGFQHSYRADAMKHPETGVLLQSDEVWERE